MTTKPQIDEKGWNFDNSYSSLPKIFYSEQLPTPVRSPKMAVLNESLAADLGLNAHSLRTNDGVEMLAGNLTPEGAFPLAQAYAGHQFGHFTMLGDGRAILLGEQVSPSGERVDIQLKGSGRTPYSRRGDGRAALGPMLREYIISEAMHALGIPTTRSLAVVTTGETIIRETELPGAILTRVASSHIRVGTFQFAAQWGTTDDLRSLADYAIQRHYSDIMTDDSRYLAFYKEVVNRQAKLIAQWQLVGFIHGVMNTDNMTISGETIDYGPCAFMDVYDPGTVFSSIDTQGRYAYGNQPPIGAWNLARLAEAMLPLFHDNEDQAVELAQDALSEFSKLFRNYWLRGMRAKLGIINEEKRDENLIEDLLSIMQTYRADFTNTFRALTFDKQEDLAFSGTPEFSKWHEQWKARVIGQDESTQSSHDLMRKSNPAVIPRNHRVEEALDAAVNGEDYSVMERLLHALSKPYAHDAEQAQFCTPAPVADRPYRTFCGT